MYGVRQVGYLVGFGPMFVASIGSNNKMAILQCQVEEKGWVTRLMAPEHVNVLNRTGGGQFPYNLDDLSNEGYENNQVVNLGVDKYLLPNFGSSFSVQGYINTYSDWKEVSFKAPNIIRNKLEWDYYGGNTGVVPTPTPTPTPAPTPTPTPTPTPAPTTTSPLSKAPVVSNTITYVAIAVAVIILILVVSNSD